MYTNAMRRVGEYIWDGKYDGDGRRRGISADSVRIEPRVLEAVGETGSRNVLMRGDALGACARLAQENKIVKCCFIDPPFDVGHSFAMGADGPVAYGDRWGEGARS